MEFFFMKSSLSVSLMLLFIYVATIILHEEERADFSEIHRLRANQKQRQHYSHCIIN